MNCSDTLYHLYCIIPEQFLDPLNSQFLIKQNIWFRGLFEIWVIGSILYLFNPLTGTSVTSCSLSAAVAPRTRDIIKNSLTFESRENLQLMNGLLSNFFTFIYFEIEVQIQNFQLIHVNLTFSNSILFTHFSSSLFDYRRILEVRFIIKHR